MLIAHSLTHSLTHSPIVNLKEVILHSRTLSPLNIQPPSVLQRSRLLGGVCAGLVVLYCFNEVGYSSLVREEIHPHSK